MTTTALQAKLLDLLAHSEWNSNNGATPECAEDVNTWFFADILAGDMGISEHALGGVVTSLQEAGLIGVNIVTKAQHRRTGDDSGIWFTEAGFNAWAALDLADKVEVVAEDEEEDKRAPKQTKAQLNAKKAARARARRAARKA